MSKDGKNPWSTLGEYDPDWESNPWQGGDFTSTEAGNDDSDGFKAYESGCPAASLVYSGPSELRATKATTDDNFPTPDVPLSSDEFAFAYLVGNVPRKASKNEFLGAMYHADTRDPKFPLLLGKCWWISEDIGTSYYNCAGYCDGLLKAERNLGESKPPHDQLAEFLRDESDLSQAYATFEQLGLKRVEGTADRLLADRDARVAVFAQGHVAIRSWYRIRETALWESKFGAWGRSVDMLRLLHELKDLERGYYGDIIAYYKPAA